MIYYNLEVNPLKPVHNTYFSLRSIVALFIQFVLVDYTRLQLNRLAFL